MERHQGGRNVRHARSIFAWSLLLLSACAAGSGANAVGINPIGGSDAFVALDGGTDGGDGDGLGDGDGTRDDGGLPPPPRDPNDEDADGSRGGVDCDDHDKDVHPGAAEVCDGKDNDCDGFADVFAIDATTFYPDQDGDGVGNAASPVRACQQPAGWVVEPGDCDDMDPEVTYDSSGEFCADEQEPVIYVAKHGHDDNAGTSPMEAVLTVRMGITRALACPERPCSVLIAAGLYEESVTMADEVSLFGGYTQDFMVRNEAVNEVILTSGEEHTLTVTTLTVPTRLDRVTVLGATLSGASGRSSHAVWVRGSVDLLRLTHVHLIAGRGEDGVPGADGVPQSCEARGGQGGESYDCGSSVGGSGDAGGDPVRGGEGEAGGSNNCPSACPLVGSDGITPGTSGRAGLAGADGNGGVPAQNAVGSFVDGAFQGALGEGGQRGFHGTGGGGGGAGGTKKIRACFGCGTILGGRGGNGAPGGCGGGGGGPGGAGGGAFALTLVDAKVLLEDSTLEGGTGGKGGSGGAGIPGAAGSLVTGTGHGDHESKKCGLIWYHSGSGGMGGTGGNGGVGGGGSGGTGGASVTLAVVGDSAANLAGDVTVLAGTGGAGGDGGGSPSHTGNTGLAGAALPQQTY